MPLPKNTSYPKEKFISAIPAHPTGDTQTYVLFIQKKYHD